MKKILVLAAALFALNAMANENLDKAMSFTQRKILTRPILLLIKLAVEGEKKACTMNAIMLFNGDGVAKDKAQAEKNFYKKCATKNEGYGLLKN